MTWYPVRITPLKQLDMGEIYQEYAADSVEPICFMCAKKQSYVSEHLDAPPGFCGWAWADLQRDATHLALGGDFPWMKKPGTMITTCTDGLRPVVFLLERLPMDYKEDTSENSKQPI